MDVEIQRTVSNELAVAGCNTEASNRANFYPCLSAAAFRYPNMKSVNSKNTAASLEGMAFGYKFAQFNKAPAMFTARSKADRAKHWAEFMAAAELAYRGSKARRTVPAIPPATSQRFTLQLIAA